MPEVADPTKLGEVHLSRYKPGETTTEGTLRRTEVTKLLNSTGGEIGELKTSRKGNVETAVQRVGGKVQHVIETTQGKDNKVEAFKVSKGNNDVVGDTYPRGELLKDGRRLGLGGWQVREGFGPNGFIGHEFRTDENGRTVVDTKRVLIDSAPGRQKIETTTVDKSNPREPSTVNKTETFDGSGNRTALDEKGDEYRGGERRVWERKGEYKVVSTGGQGRIERGTVDVDQAVTSNGRTDRSQEKTVFRKTFNESGLIESSHFEEIRRSLDAQGQPISSSSGVPIITETDYEHHQNSTPGNVLIRHAVGYDVDSKGERQFRYTEDSTVDGNRYVTKVRNALPVVGTGITTTHYAWEAGRGWVETKPVENTGVRAKLSNIRHQLRGK